MKIGVLALQGAVQEHINAIKASGAEAVIVKRVEHLEGLDGIVLPGGESTAMRKLLDHIGLLQPLKDKIENGLPAFGTCAGMILLSKEIANDDTVHLGVMDMVSERNAFGRQVDSFEVNIPIKGVCEDFPSVFIRAPFIRSVSGDAEVIAEHDGNIVAVKQNHMLAASFHPELTNDYRLMNYFVSMVKEKNANLSM
ncbi:pyridoxal 5'-phosphate synthase glutaminase subunit PdxT [Gottfriedia solisilvae]|uniref:Pyridoxal 5'-phosphate synthase subunit PdxT n=1 Tax=Gottfriedia solisilvae TaxID=1516104 RepID=A0A8J3AX99_9BACI|nr:pyridoxal 5'-phosphate synthase glutaminase subunit PdxT [Gottfriedia solisilvae]GGI18527.1 pyridoxal 5'-phosphate synthase subunit PdxT [Gottfriedia solisilvae]